MHATHGSAGRHAAILYDSIACRCSMQRTGVVAGLRDAQRQCALRPLSLPRARAAGAERPREPRARGAGARLCRKQGPTKVRPDSLAASRLYPHQRAPQVAPGSGPPRPIRRLCRADRPHRACCRRRWTPRRASASLPVTVGPQAVTVGPQAVTLCLQAVTVCHIGVDVGARRA